MGLWVLMGMLRPARSPYLSTMLVGDSDRHFRMGGGLLRIFVAYGILSMSPPAHGWTDHGIHTYIELYLYSWVCSWQAERLRFEVKFESVTFKSMKYVPWRFPWHLGCSHVRKMWLD